MNDIILISKRADSLRRHLLNQLLEGDADGAAETLAILMRIALWMLDLQLLHSSKAFDRLLIANFEAATATRGMGDVLDGLNYRSIPKLNTAGFDRFGNQNYNPTFKPKNGCSR